MEFRREQRHTGVGLASFPVSPLSLCRNLSQWGKRSSPRHCSAGMAWSAWAGQPDCCAEQETQLRGRSIPADVNCPVTGAVAGLTGGNAALAGSGCASVAISAMR